jgi:hypothetical protein
MLKTLRDGIGYFSLKYRVILGFLGPDLVASCDAKGSSSALELSN